MSKIHFNSLNEEDESEILDILDEIDYSKENNISQNFLSFEQTMSQNNQVYCTENKLFVFCDSKFELDKFISLNLFHFKCTSVII